MRPSGASPLADGGARTVVLVRPGETAAPDGSEATARAGRGEPGPPLTTRGRTQAARAADVVFRVGKDRWPDLPRAASLAAAPALGALETAAAIGRRIGRHPRPDERFAEGDGSAPDEGGERAWAGLRDAVAAADDGAAVIVAGTATIRALVGRALGAPGDAWPRLRVPPGSLSILRLVVDGDEMHAVEVTTAGHPTDG